METLNIDHHEVLTDSDYVARYETLVEFLGAALGPTVEIVLHDVADLDASVVAIANGGVSGRTLGSPATALMLRVLRAGETDQRPYVTGYSAVSSTNASSLRSATYFIRREQRIVGMLCINAGQTLLRSLVELTDAIGESYFTDEPQEELDSTENKTEHLVVSIAEITDAYISAAVASRGISAHEFSKEDRIAVVRTLDGDGFFQLKGSVAALAVALDISEPSIYRYIRYVRT